jgi:hypothetical protein
MSGQYSPDEAAEPVGTWTTVFLSNRDLSGQIPINFVTHPGVCLAAACFSNGTYTAGIAQKCVSNLLATQFRRLILDLYWDGGNGQFSFCPVAVPASQGSEHNSVALSASAISAVSLSRSATKLVVGQTISASSVSPSAVASSNFTSSTTLSPTNTTSSPPAATSNISGETTYDLGPYQCSPDLDLSFFISVMSDYLSATSNTIDAKLIYIELNLHASASSANPQGPAQEPSSFPGPGVLIGAQFSNLDHSPVYQPSDLASDRRNLNNSWFRNPSNRWPIAAYLTLDERSDGDLSSPSGWPDENYVQLTIEKRVLLGWGTIDPQMAKYNFSGDTDIIFSRTEMTAPRTIQASADGSLTSGCFYGGTFEVGDSNSSWAMTSYSDNSFQDPSLMTNITSCGISPILNSTLSEGGASSNMKPYTSIAQSAIWNWAPGEPRNTSAPGVDLDAPRSQYRCAYFDATATHGRWSVHDCLHHYAVACRVANEPYRWTVFSDSVPYCACADLGVCPENASFDLPRTGLENTYLYNHILAVRQAANSNDPKGVWINFNSLDVEGCWVTSGPNGTCPYFEHLNSTPSRQVVVPTIAAIIVLILTALTLFVKCNVNRRNSRNRRRGEGGWDYEGVPS